MRKIGWLAIGIFCYLCLPAVVPAYDVTIYGVADLSFDSIDDGDETENYIISNSSYIGITIQKELRPELKGFAQYEVTYTLDGEGDKGDQDADGNDNPIIGSRNSGVGLDSKFGKLWFAGSWNEPLKQWGGGPPIDNFCSRLGQNSYVIGGDYRVKNAIFYESPSIQGFQLMVAKGFDEGDNDNSTPGDVFSSDMVSAALRYVLKDERIGDIYLCLSTRQENHYNGMDYDDEVYRFTGLYGRSLYAGSYTRLAFIYNVDNYTDDVREVTAYWIGLMHRINDWELNIAYGSAEDDISEQEQDMMAAGVAYNFSKDFSVYATYAESNLDDDSLSALYNFGGNGRNESLAFPSGADKMSGVSVGFSFRFKNLITASK